MPVDGGVVETRVPYGRGFYVNNNSTLNVKLRHFLHFPRTLRLFPTPLKIMLLCIWTDTQCHVDKLLKYHVAINYLVMVGSTRKRGI